MESLEGFSEEAMVLQAANNGQIPTTNKQCIGPVLLFERLWRELGIGESIKRHLSGRKFEFNVERAVFVSTLHRLMDPGSDRACSHWMTHHDIEGTEDLQLHHLYRAMAWLGEVKQVDSQKAFPFGAVTVNDQIEKTLFERRKNLFTDLSMVFLDTTSLFFHGEGGEVLGERGYSKDNRPDLKQMIVGVVLDNNDVPVASMMLPGNTNDTTSFIPFVTRLREQFVINQACVVADRGMISAGNKNALVKAGIDYILGARMKLVKQIKEKVLSHPGRYSEVRLHREESPDPEPLKVKEVDKDEARYILCLNPEQEKKEKQKREAIIRDLEQKLESGFDKQFVGNKGYRRYLKEPGEGGFAIDREKIKNQARFDGKWVLETTTDLSPRQVALKYKQLWEVERVFDQMKNTLRTRPIYHQTDEAIRGHVFCSFLALILRKELEDRLQEEGVTIEWEQFKRDLDGLEEVTVKKGDKEFILRTDSKGKVGKVLQAVGVQPPKKIRKADSRQPIAKKTFLYKHHGRYYNFRLGRFISGDPMGIWYDTLAYGNGYSSFR